MLDICCHYEIRIDDVVFDIEHPGVAGVNAALELQNLSINISIMLRIGEDASYDFLIYPWEST